jgi:polyribonucleotide nucleotidyltransferase
MDFKVAGTRKGVTGLQMDIKIDGLTFEIMEKALEQAHKGRNFILDKMDEVIAKPAEQVSELAPRIITMTIDPSKIREVIGSGGSVIRDITEKTGTDIDINDDGVVTISGKNMAAAESAKEIVMGIVSDPEIGAVYEGKVKRIMEFGAIVEFLPGKTGMVHISRLSQDRVRAVEDVVKLGDMVKVKIIRIDFDKGKQRIDLSMKDAK